MDRKKSLFRYIQATILVFIFYSLCLSQITAAVAANMQYAMDEICIVFGPSSPLGALFETMFHTRLLFTFEGLVTGSILINIPFMMNPLISGMESLPESLIDASYVLGKSRLETFIKVVLPSVIPSFPAGSAMTFIHSMGEFGLVR